MGRPEANQRLCPGIHAEQTRVPRWLSLGLQRGTRLPNGTGGCKQGSDTGRSLLVPQALPREWTGREGGEGKEGPPGVC